MRTGHVRHTSLEICDAIDVRSSLEAESGASVMGSIQSVGWSHLTRDGEKERLYAVDTHFREGLDEFEVHCGHDGRRVLHSAALVLIKPDALVTGNFETIVNFFASRGLTYVFADLVTFDRLTSRELWRYQHTLATPDRLAVEDIALTAGPSVLLLASYTGSVPATVYASELKGAAGVGKGSNRTLRSVLNRPNPLFSMLHTSDEPADLLRELSILLPPESRSAAWAALNGRADPVRVERVLGYAELEQGTLQIDLNASYSTVVTVLEALAQTHAHESKAQCALDMLRRSREGDRLEFRRFMSVISDLPV
jgi:nucleoside diphosphate kinase